MYSTNSPATDGGRSEKLLAARKKLKQFQSRRRSTSRSYTGGIDNNTNRGNDENRERENYDDGGHRHRSQQRQGDEGDMEDGRPMSECYPGYSTESLAESTASTTKATKAARARRASAASSRYLETPEPMRISVAPEQQQEIFRQQQEKQASGAFYHDEQRSPFQRVKRESESSETTMVSFFLLLRSLGFFGFVLSSPITCIFLFQNTSAKPIDAQSQHVSLKNEFSVSSSSSAEPENQIRYQNQVADSSNRGTNSTSLSSAAAASASSDVSPKSARHRSGDEEIILNMDDTSMANSQAATIAPVNEYGLQQPVLQYDGAKVAISKFGGNSSVSQEREFKSDEAASEKVRTDFSFAF